MKIRSIEELDHYEVLGVPRTVSPADILRAYLAAIAAYHPEGLATYSLLSNEERRLMLARIDEAYAVLSDPERRAGYDERTALGSGSSGPLARVRRSTKPLEIHDADRKRKGRKNLFGLFRRRKRAQSEAYPASGVPSESLSAAEKVLRGDLLRALRLHRGMTLESASQALRISPRTLEALESGEAGAIFEETQRYALLVSYAKTLGLDVDALG